MTTQQKIRDEISALSRFYGIDPQPFFGLLSPDALEHYVELVLDEQELAVVLGGVGREDRLLETADKFGIAGEVRSAFKACTLQFPERMLYAKFPVSGKPKGVMYVLLLEPWETVSAFLDFMFPGQFEAAALPGSTGDHSLCFILGFTVDQDQLTIKAYELFDRVGHDRSDPPFLVVHHLTRKGLVPNRKTYAANVSPEDFLAGEGPWPEIVELISGTPFNFGDYAMLRSLEASGKQKMYVFRLDRRENATFNLRTYNYYVAEGLKNIQLQRFEAAHRSFENAVDYDPENPDAINGLGFCMMYRGKYAEGIELVLKARALNPRIANLVWNWGYPPGNIRELIEDLSRQIAEKPAADLFHQVASARLAHELLVRRDFAPHADVAHAVHVHQQRVHRDHRDTALLELHGGVLQVVELHGLEAAEVPAVIDVQVDLAQEALVVLDHELRKSHQLRLRPGYGWPGPQGAAHIPDEQGSLVPHSRQHDRRTFPAGRLASFRKGGKGRLK